MTVVVVLGVVDVVVVVVGKGPATTMCTLHTYLDCTENGTAKMAPRVNGTRLDREREKYFI